MKRRLLAPLVIVTALALSLVFAGSALALPSYGMCSNCHSLDAGVAVHATQTSNNGTTANYNVTVTGSLAGFGWAVYNGNTRITYGTGSSGTFSVPVGKTYTVFGGNADSNTQLYNTTSISPTAPAPTPTPDTTPPVTTSDAVASYLSTATIHLHATDNVGGSGVAHTYYILDAAPQVESTTVTTSIVGTHTLEFWSVDASGNIELPHKSATFAVTAPPAPPAPTPDTTAPVTTSDAVASYAGTATIHFTAKDNPGGSGVAHTYYILDAAAQVEGTSVTTSIVGTHTLEFWSVDASGNIETPHHLANFTVTAPVVTPQTYSYSYKFATKGRIYKGLKAVLTNITTRARYIVPVNRKGVANWTKLPAGTYQVGVMGNGHFRFKKVVVITLGS